MITKIGVPFKGLAGDGFSGSYKGMRFFMKTYDKENISVFVYPEPYNFENTKDENKEKVEFPYTHEGVDQCIDWLNQKYIDDKDAKKHAVVNGVLMVHRGWGKDTDA